MIAPETSSSQWKSSVDSKQHETWATRSGDLTIAGGRGGDCTEGMWGPLRGPEEDVMTRLVTRPVTSPVTHSVHGALSPRVWYKENFTALILTKIGSSS